MNKKFLYTAAGITLGILILTLLLSPKATAPTTPTAPTTSNSQLRSELTNLADDKRKAASAYVELIADRLPFFLENFETSAGITTTINIFRLEGDPDEIVRLEITGLSYLNKTELDEKKNPNVAAFKESYLKALSLLKESGIDPHQLIFVYGDKDYVVASASYWVDKLGLLR